jgi:diguanylate cyclase
MMDKRIIALIAISILTIGGMLITPATEEYALTRYILNGFGLFLLPLFGAWLGLDAVKGYSVKSTLGKATLLISIGIFFYGIGTLIFFYYNVFLNTEIAYPSYADLFFLLFAIIANYGLVLLLISLKPKFSFKNIIKMIIPLLLILPTTYFVFIQSKLGEETELLAKILNVIYPLSDALFLSFAIMILILTLGGSLFKTLLILSGGFILQAVADFSFVYTATAGTYYTGSWVDIVYTLAFLVMGFGMYHIYTSQKSMLGNQEN